MMNNPYVPEYIFLTKGVGVDKEKLTSFEIALRDAKLAPENLVKVSSIFPPRCKYLPRDEGIKRLDPGQITYAVISENTANEPHRLIAASIGMANPPEEEHYGYLSEHHDVGLSEEKCGDFAEKLAVKMFCSIHEIPFDMNSYEPKKYARVCEIGNYRLRTTNITQSATVGKDGLWTSVVAAAVFVPFYPDYEAMISRAMEPYIKRLEAIEKTSNRDNKITEYILGEFHKIIKFLGVSAERDRKDLEGIIKDDIEFRNNKT